MRNSFIETMKEIFHDWDLKVMSYVMVVVTATCMITATVAWFYSSSITKVSAMEMKTATAELIRLAVETGGEDVDVLRGNGETPEASITMPVFSNVYVSNEQNLAADGENPTIMAPGTFGSITLYVTPMKAQITKCYILPSFFGSEKNKEGLTFMDGVTDEDKEVIEKLVQGHILFFGEYDADSKTYSNRLTEENPLEHPLLWENGKGVEEPITIYWYWPYEYQEVPEEMKTESFKENLFEEDRLAENKYTNEQLYDFADTKIGTYVKSMKVHFEVSVGNEIANN